MATIPLSATNIRLMSNVPFASDYKDTRLFSSLSEQENYFNNKPTVYSMRNCSFQREGNVNYIRVSASIDKLFFTNYLVFQNPEFGQKKFYAFVTKVEYVNTQTTLIHFKLDVFQTWFFDVTFKQSFVDREHTTLVETNGLPVVNTNDEGLAYGTDYVTVSEKIILPSKFQYLVIVTNKQIAVRDDNANTPIRRKKRYIGAPSALFYYVLPFTRDNLSVPQYDGAYLINLDLLTSVISEDTNIVNTIQAMYYTDYIGINFDESNTNNIPNTTDRVERVKILTDDGGEYRILHVNPINTFEQKIITVDDNKYSGFTNTAETKLFMYPYTLTEIDTFRGDRTTIKNELIDGYKLNIRIKGSIGDTNKVSYEPLNYLNNSNYSSSYQQAVIDSSINAVPIVSDYGAAMMQGSRNSLQARKDNAQYSAYSNIYSGVASGVSQWFNPLGAIASGSDKIQQGANQYFSEIRNINAKIADAVNVPPNVSNMGGNASFDNGNGFQGVRIVKKEITHENRIRLENFFNMYGYKINKTKVPNLNTRTHWNYVKTIGLMIVANMNNEDIQEFKNIFDNGVTLWHIDDIGNYDYVNEVR